MGLQRLHQAGNAIALEAVWPIDQVERAAQSRQGACLCPLLTHQRQQAGGQEHGANACLGQLDQCQVGIELPWRG